MAPYKVQTFFTFVMNELIEIFYFYIAGLLFPDLKIEGSENADASPSDSSSWFFW